MQFWFVGCGDMGWIELARDRERWWAFGNEVMNLGFQKMHGIS